MTFSVNVTAPADPAYNDSISGFLVELQFNQTVLTNPTLDYSTNVLANFQLAGDTSIPRYCINGLNPSGNTQLCSNQDGGGIISFGEVIQGSFQTDLQTTGNLFTVTFQVAAKNPATSTYVGFSPMQIIVGKLVVFSTLTNPPSTVVVPSQQFSGYYVNIDCPRGSLQACKPPVVDFAWSPLTPNIGQLTRFNATATASTGSSIVDYYWTWSDLTGTGFVDTGTNHTAVHSWLNANTNGYLVTLQVKDSNGLVGQVTHSVQVINTNVDLQVLDLEVAPGSSNVLPGAVLTFTVTILNNSPSALNGNYTLTLDNGQVLNSSRFRLGAFDQAKFRTVWDTSRYQPRVYRLDAYAPPPPGDVSPVNSRKSAWVQLIYPFPGGFQLALLPSVGLGIAILGGGGYAASKIRARRRFDDTPL